jgi:hypothetical protein
LIDMTLRCPVCGDRADMCFAHGDDWKKRPTAPADTDRWLAWSGGRYPDDSPGGVVHAESDGTIVLDDGVTTWNPLRALDWFARRHDSTIGGSDACTTSQRPLSASSPTGLGADRADDAGAVLDDRRSSETVVASTAHVAPPRSDLVAALSAGSTHDLLDEVRARAEAVLHDARALFGSLADVSRGGTAEFARDVLAVLAACDRLRDALQAYHDLVPALAECANECGEARLYSDLKQANDVAAAALEAER